jgi:hypothetical protein
MIKTIKLSSQEKLYAVLSYDYMDLHSVWTKESDANEIVDILNHEQLSHYIVEEHEINPPKDIKKGVRVIINLNTREICKDNYEKDKNQFVICEDSIICEPYNFTMARDISDEVLTILGLERRSCYSETPRKINGKWRVQYTHDNWDDFFKEFGDNLEKILVNSGECCVYAIGETEEEALKNSKDYLESIIQDLEETYE